MRKILASIAAVTTSMTAAVAVSDPVSAAPSLRFHGTQYDSPGRDTRSNASLNAEWISLINTGSRAVNLNGYKIADEAGRVYTFGNVSIAADGGRIWLHTGSGTNTTKHRYWGSGNYIWNNTGDTANLRRPTGTAVDTCTWGSKAGRTWVAC